MRKPNEEWSSQLWSQFSQLRKEAWKKFRTSTGLGPVTSRYRCDALPTELWSHWRWEQVNFGFICSRERYEGEWCIWNKAYVNCGYEIKWRMRSRVQAPLKSWIFFRLLYAIAKIAIITARIILHLISYPQFTYDLFHMHHSKWEKF